MHECSCDIEQARKRMCFVVTDLVEKRIDELNHRAVVPLASDSAQLYRRTSLQLAPGTQQSVFWTNNISSHNYFFSSNSTNPIGRLFGSCGFISSRMALRIPVIA